MGHLYHDSLWIYLKADFGGVDYTVYRSSPEGVRCDVAGYDFDWNAPEWTVESRKGKGFWGLKYTVPIFRVLQRTGGKAIDKVLGINVRRIRKTELYCS